MHPDSPGPSHTGQSGSADGALLDARRLSVRHAGGTLGLDDLDLVLPGSGIVCLLGANGAGKTTLLECAAGIVPAASGRLLVNGQPPGSPHLRNTVGVMLQDGGLPGAARPREFLEYVARLYPRPRDVRALLGRVGVDPDTRTPIRRLSGGQARRVAWAAAMVGNASTLILDEPTAGVDPVGRENFYDVLHEERDRGVAVIVSTHLVEDVEQLADFVAVLRHGRLALCGTPEELRPRTSLIVRSPREMDRDVLVAALPPGSSCIKTSRDSYEVSVPSGIDPSVLTTVASWCAQHSVVPDTSIADLRSVLWNALRDVEPGS